MNQNIRIKILRLLIEKPLSYTKIQTKLSTNYDSVKNNCRELQTYGLVAIKTIDKDPNNGRESHIVSLTENGVKSLKNFDKK